MVTGQYYSWEVVDTDIAIKRIDKSVMEYGQTGVPIEIREFWEAERLAKGERKDIIICYGGYRYKAAIQMENSSRLRTKMYWPKSFSEKVMECPDALYIRFKRNGKISILQNLYVVKRRMTIRWMKQAKMERRRVKKSIFMQPAMSATLKIV